MKNPNEILRKANELFAARRWNEAAGLYETLDGEFPPKPFVLNKLVTIARHRKDWKAVIEYVERSLQLDPSQHKLLPFLGNALAQEKRDAEALASFDKALSFGVDTAGVHEGRGNALRNLGRIPEAMAAYDAALRMNPMAHGVLCNRGMLVAESGRYEEALASFEAAVAAKPDFGKAHANRGMIALYLRRYEEAMAAYEAAIRCEPDRPAGYWGKAELLLMSGQHALGWELMQRRPGATKTVLEGVPVWDGRQDVARKVVLVLHEVGLGDYLMYVRYIPALLSLGARVVLNPLEPLADLLSQIPGAVEVVPRGKPLPAVDLQCKVMSLPYALRASVPDIPAPPYLHASAQRVAKWAALLPDRQALRVGVVWAGKADRSIDRMPIRTRSVPLAKLLPLLQLPCEFHCLQKDISDADRSLLAATGTRITLHADALADMHDTAALAHHMDLVISIDTSVAHLAGALGARLWVMLAYASDYRWAMGERTPWYPQATLLRQHEPANWDQVVREAQERLAQLAAPVTGA